MEQREVRQTERAAGLSGRQFLFGVAGIIVQLAISQIVVNLAITLTGIGLLNIAFYVFAVWLLVRFMRRTVAGYTYVLNHENLVLESRLGDSTVSVVTIPLAAVLSVRPARCAESLRVSYRQVTYVGQNVAVPLRMRLARALAVLSARAARRIAGNTVDARHGMVIAYTENQQPKAVVFAPNEEMCEALKTVLQDRYGWDDRLARPMEEKYSARALQRAFPAFYPNVEPLLSKEDEQWAEEQRAKAAERRAKAERKKKHAAKDAAKEQK